MLDKQLLGIIGVLMCILGILLPASIDEHCAGFFKFDWENPYLTRFTCASSLQGNILSWWGDRTDWATDRNERLMSAFLVVAVLGVTIAVITKIYLIIWGLVPIMIAFTINLQSKLTHPYVIWPAWIAFMFGYILLIIAACTKEPKSN